MLSDERAREVLAEAVVQVCGREKLYDVNEIVGRFLAALAEAGLVVREADPESPDGLRLLTEFSQAGTRRSSVDAYVDDLEGRLHSAASAVDTLVAELEDGQAISVEHGLRSLRGSLVDGLPAPPDGGTS